MQKKIKMQLIGMVSGLEREQSVSDFGELQTRLEAQGYEVVNPMELVPPDSSWHDAMRLCIASLLTVDAVAMVNNDWWLLSDGALVEYAVAAALGLEVMI